MADVSIRRVIIEYEDGTVVAYKETDDFFIGKTFFKTLVSNPDLETKVMKRASLPQTLIAKVSNFFKI